MVLRNPLVALPFRTNTEVSENTRVTLKSRQHAYHTPHAHPYYNYLKYFTIFSRWPHIIDKGFAHIRRNWVLLKFYKVWFTELCFHDVKNQEKWNGYGSYFLCYIKGWCYWASPDCVGLYVDCWTGFWQCITRQPYDFIQHHQILSSVQFKNSTNSNEVIWDKVMYKKSSL